MKNVKGFTLIELIVVMAIIGVLAGILVPVFTSYMEEARLSVANANAKTVFSNSANYGVKCQVNGVSTVDSVNSQKVPTVSVNEIIPDDGKNLVKFMGRNLGISDKSSGYFSVKMEGILPKDAAWAASDDTDIVGKYPEPASEVGASLDLSSGSNAG